MPSVCKKGNAFRIFVSLGSDGAGKPVRKCTTYHPPVCSNEKRARHLAETYAYQYEARCRRKAMLGDASTMEDLTEWYFGTEAPLKVKDSTLQNERNLVNNYVLPAMGHIKLRDVTPLRLDALFHELLTAGGKNKTGLSPGTVTLIRNTLSGIFTTAVEKGITDENPVKRSLRPKEQEKERAFLDASGCRLLMEKLPDMKNQQAARAIEILLLTGMRRGELLALHWEDVDFRKREIQVRYTLYTHNGIPELTTPKTKSSVRTIPLPKEAVRLLRDQQQYIKELRKKHRKGWQKTGACLVNLHGGYLNGEFLNNTFRKFLKENGFPPLHLHDLRHANASLLINSGVPMKIVSEHLGHQSMKTTEGFYTHLFTDAKKITAEAITKALNT